MNHGTRGIVLLLTLAVIALGASASPVINEIAWAGTAASSADEWIELYNPSAEDVDLAGWILRFGDVEIHLGEAEGATKESRTATIPAGGFFVLERTDDEAVSDRTADLLYSGSLHNDGMAIILFDAEGNEVDSANREGGAWPGGHGATGVPAWATMERIDPLQGDAPSNWATNDGTRRARLDADGNPLNGTPGADNSATIVARSAPRVVLLHPNEDGTTVRGTFVVTWEATDPDGDAESLQVDLWLWTPREEWILIAEGLANGGAYTWDSTSVADDAGYRVQILVRDPDGITTRVEGAAFAVANAP